MKKLIKILGISLLVLVVALFSLPYLFKSQLVEVVKEEINNNVNAQVTFQDVNLSLFRDFPNLSLDLEEINVVGLNDFDQDTLAFMKDFYFSFNLMSVIKGDAYEVKKIKISEPYFNIKILKNGKANYDIAKESDDTSSETSSDAHFVLSMKKIEIENARIVYNDMEGEMYFDLNQMNALIAGDFTESSTTIALSMESPNMNFIMEGVRYLNKVNTNFTAKLLADMDAWKFTFDENKLTLNALPLAFDGWVEMPNDDIKMDLNFSSQDADFKSILSMVPAMYSKEYEGLKASGTASVKGYVKGIYNAVKMPNIDANILVENGNFQYPDLPTELKKVFMDLHFSSPDEDYDHVKINLKKLQWELEGNPFQMRLKLEQPISNPKIDMQMKGKVDFAKISKLIPLEANSKIKGVFDADLQLKADQNSILKQRFRKVLAAGSLSLKKFYYADSALEEGIEIPKASMDFSPRFIQIPLMEIHYLGNKINFEGRLENYVDYAFGDGILKGKATLKSEYLNLDKIMADDGNAVESSDSLSETALEAVEIPDNLDIAFQAFIGRMKYQDLSIHAIYGSLKVVDKRLEMENLNMELLDGKMLMNGYYSTTNIDSPDVSYVLGIRDFNIAKTYKSIGLVKKLVPIAQYIKGDFSAMLSIDSKLDHAMNPQLNSINSDGVLQTSEIQIMDAPLTRVLADQLKYDKLQKMNVKPAMIQYTIENGTITLKPTPLKINGMDAEISGVSNLDKSIAYNLKMEVPKSKLGPQANDMIKNLNGQASKLGIALNDEENIPVEAIIGGRMGQPTVQIQIKNPVDDAKQQLEDKVKEEIDKAKQEALDEAEKLKKQAEAEAEKLKQEALKQAKSEAEKAKILLEAKKKELAKKKKEEEEKAKKKLKEEAKKKLKGWF